MSYEAPRISPVSWGFHCRNRNRGSGVDDLCRTGCGLTARNARWFRGTRLGVLLPYALSGQALEYYEWLIEGYRTRSWKTHIEPHSPMDYSAMVTHHDVFERGGKIFRDAEVVEMKLTFQTDLTQVGTQGIHFKKIRAVVLDGKGAVLAVFGDGLTEAPTLAI